MLSLWIIEHLDLVEYVLPGLGSGFIVPAPYPFALEEIEEALRDRVVMAVAASAHGMFQIVGPEE